MHVLVVAHGDRPMRAGLDAAWPGWDRGAALVVAADGGAATARALGLRLDACVGDADSIDRSTLAALERDGVEVVLAPVDKDESDAELALLLALERGASEVTLIGALGGPRVDHALANIGLLFHPALAGRPMRLLDGRSRVSLVEAPGPGGSLVKRSLGGRAGDLVTLLPCDGPVEGITTGGLRYPLRDEGLEPGPARGLSNVRIEEDAWITVRGGRLLVVESVAEPAVTAGTLRP